MKKLLIGALFGDRRRETGRFVILVFLFVLPGLVQGISRNHEIAVGHSSPVTQYFNHAGLKFIHAENTTHDRPVKIHLYGPKGKLIQQSEKYIIAWLPRGTYYLLLTGGLSDANELAECRLKINAFTHQKVTCSGVEVLVDGWVNAGERIDLVHKPASDKFLNLNSYGHSIDPVSIYALSPEGETTFSGYYSHGTTSNGRSGSASLSISRSHNRMSLIVSKRSNDITRGEYLPVHLLVNDVNLPGHDTDKDGLGKNLEYQLKTCSSALIVGGFNCAKVTDFADTDQDGIPDGLEVLGKRQGNPELPLPLWGANPRHKDLFLEVDFQRQTIDEHNEDLNYKMKPEVVKNFVRQFSYEYQDDLELIAINARNLKNPDGKPGINVHLDIGVNPTEAENYIPEIGDFTRFGDWGGYDATAPVEKRDNDGNIIYDDNGQVIWTGVSYKTAWKSYLSDNRKGIFHHALGRHRGSGQAYGTTAIFNFWSNSIPHHEIGHTLGLGHSGPSYQEPKEFNCKPNLLSIMSYAAKDNEVFSDTSYQVFPLNNASVEEWGAIDLSRPDRAAKVIDYLQSPFEYLVTPEGHVDWNRDGIIADPGTKVRGYLNNTGGSCEGTRINQTILSSFYGQSAGSTTLTRFNDKLYLFTVDKSTKLVRFNSTHYDFNCEITDDYCGLNSWDHQYVSLFAAGGVDAKSIHYYSDYQKKELLLVAAINGVGELWTVHYDGDEWSTPEKHELVTSAGTSLMAKGEPTLVDYSKDGSDGHLVFKSEEDRLYRLRFDISGNSVSWSTASPVVVNELYPESQHAKTSPTNSPKLLYIFNPELPSSQISGYTAKELFLIYSEPFGRMVFAKYDPSTEQYKKTTTLFAPAYGRVAGAWLPNSEQNPYSGHLHLFFIWDVDGSPGWIQKIRGYSTIKSTNEPFTPKHVFKSFGMFDNIHVSGHGLAAIYEPGKDKNLKMAITTLGHKINFRPVADGIADYTYHHFDEWKSMGDRLCESTVKFGGETHSTIRC